MINDTGEAYTGELTFSYDIECWIQRMPGYTGGFAFKVNGQVLDTSYLFNLDAEPWSENFWINGNENAVSVSVPHTVDLPPDGILIPEWNGRDGLPDGTRKLVGAGIDNLSITGETTVENDSTLFWPNGQRTESARRHSKGNLCPW